jgi:hypothetical protein
MTNTEKAERPASLRPMEEAGEVSKLEVNEVGYVQEIPRNFGLLSICGVAIVTGNTWAGLAGTIVRVVLLFISRTARCTDCITRPLPFIMVEHLESYMNCKLLFIKGF